MAKRCQLSMKSLDEYLRDAEQAHGHLCAGQVLGVRLAMLGLIKLGIDDPHGNDRKRAGQPSHRTKKIVAHSPIHTTSTKCQ